MSFLLLFGCVVVLLVFSLARTHWKGSRLSGASWEELVAKLQPVKRDGITEVALEYLHPVKSQLGLEPSEMWAKVGGMEGLKAMRANAEVLIALAAYAQRWNFHESAIVAERMRHDGLALRRATIGVTRGLMRGQAGLRVPFYVHEAASSYYLMRERLLALYETSHAGRYPMLADAL